MNMLLNLFQPYWMLLESWCSGKQTKRPTVPATSTAEGRQKGKEPGWLFLFPNWIMILKFTQKGRLLDLNVPEDFGKKMFLSDVQIFPFTFTVFLKLHLHVCHWRIPQVYASQCYVLNDCLSRVCLKHMMQCLRSQKDLIGTARHALSNGYALSNRKF